MIVASNATGERLLAWRTEKSVFPFFCPECGGDVLLKKGKIRQHHFAHVSGSDCPYSTGETQTHLRVKKEMYLAFNSHAGCAKCEIERRLKGVRPDISLYIGKTPVAVEIQCSSISCEEIDRRMLAYKKLGIWVVWVISDIPRREDGLYKPNKWQRFLHQKYSGRLYVYQKGISLLVVHLECVKHYVEARELYRDGELIEVGGYENYSKVLSVMLTPPTPILNLVNDFGTEPCTKWVWKRYNLWIDDVRCWWEDWHWPMV